VRRAPGDPQGHFCVKVQGVPTVEIAPGFPQLATAPVVSAGTGIASAARTGACDDGTEVDVRTFAVNGTLTDANFSLVVP
jgi:hypothetical protein